MEKQPLEPYKLTAGYEMEFECGVVIFGQIGGGGYLCCFALWRLVKCVCECHVIVEPLPFCRDRVQLFFQDLSSHLSRVITSAAHNQFLLERGVVSVLCLAGRLLGRGDFPVIEVSK